MKAGNKKIKVIDVAGDGVATVPGPWPGLTQRSATGGSMSFNSLALASSLREQSHRKRCRIQVGFTRRRSLARPKYKRLGLGPVQRHPRPSRRCLLTPLSFCWSLLFLPGCCFLFAPPTVEGVTTEQCTTLKPNQMDSLSDSDVSK